MSAASRASELQKVYQNMKTAAGNAWEDILLENTRSVSTPLATRMLSQMGLGKDTSAPFRLLENACGAGVVAPLLQRIIKPEVLKLSSILCGDFSDQVVELAKKRIESEGWVNTQATKVDGQVRHIITTLPAASCFANMWTENRSCGRHFHSCCDKHWFSRHARLRGGLERYVSHSPRPRRTLGSH